MLDKAFFSVVVSGYFNLMAIDYSRQYKNNNFVYYGIKILQYDFTLKSMLSISGFSYLSCKNLEFKIK